MNTMIVIVPLGGSIVTLNRGGTMMSTKKYRIRLTTDELRWYPKKLDNWLRESPAPKITGN